MADAFLADDEAVRTDVAQAVLPELTTGDGGAASEAPLVETPPASTRTTSRQKDSAPRSGPKWEEEARTRLRSSLKHLSKPIADAQQRDANEADTRLLITEVLCEGFGYHRFNDLDTEYAVRGQYADYGLRIDKQLVAFVEVKRSTTKLATKHLHQVEMYAVNEGVEWIILTNSVVWQLYHLEGGLPVTLDLVLEIDVLAGDSPAVLATKLLPMTREATKRGVLDALWRQVRATSPQSVAKSIMAPTVVKAIRSELHRQTGHLVSMDEVARIVRDTVLRPETCV